MNIELFIARRFLFNKDNDKVISRPIVKIAIVSISLGLSVMILSVAIITGFHSEISKKVIGFGSHIQITNYDTNTSFETVPINKDQENLKGLSNTPGVKHIQSFATKAGIIKANNEIQGVVLKGVGSDYSWEFFEHNLVEGNLLSINDSVKTNDVVISRKIARLLKLHVGDRMDMFFVQQPPRMRKFSVAGIYETGLEKFDNTIIIADIKHLQKLNDWTTSQVSGFEIEIENFKDIDLITDELYNKIGLMFYEDGTKLRVRSIKEKDPEIFDWLELLNINVWVILILIVAVASFNMISGFLIMILEQTRSIGVLKALGTENWSVRKIFLYNAGFLIGKGLLWGNLIGISLCLIQYYFNIIKLDPTSYYVNYVPINLKITHLVFLNLGTLLVTLLMLLGPSYLITRISPVRAIRFN